MASHDVNFSGSGLPDTVLEAEPPELLAGLVEAGRLEGAQKRASIATLAAAHPRSPTVWAALGDCGRDDIEAYAAYRVGYHRGLDALRQGGWRGTGYVRWRHEPNRGFLRCLDGLRRMAAVIGEDDEAGRCDQFLRQLDPDWPPEDH